MQEGFESAMAGVVRVECGSRLHFGFTNLSKELGRCYGSIGVGLDEPRVVLEISRASDLSVEAESPEQILQYLERFRRRFGLETRVHVREVCKIPEHSGLGSGTRVAMALGMGLSRLYRLSIDLPELARAMGRGRRSSVGILTFTAGGFVVDAGHRQGAEASRGPTVVFHRPFPEDWRFVVCIPTPEEGLSGGAEEKVFRALYPPVSVTERICCIVQLELLPSLVEEDIRGFGHALTEIDRRTGSFFEAAQGGVTAQTVGEQIIECMLDAGAFGGGQSSWGPAVYGLVRSDGEAVVERAVRKFLEERGLEGTVFVARGRNWGATAGVEKAATGPSDDQSAPGLPQHGLSRGLPWQ
ncbi:MAG: beta-ribofuranosylaminobenzene 5'-phosphate synthase [Thermoleophilia bacterium]